MGFPVRRVARLDLTSTAIQGLRSLHLPLLLEHPRLLADLLLDHLLPHALLYGLTQCQLFRDALARVVGAVQRQVLALSLIHI